MACFPMRAGRPMRSPARKTELKSIPEHQVTHVETHAYCWACRALVVIPTVGPNSSLAPVYKCGWCGALNPKTRDDFDTPSCSDVDVSEALEATAQQKCSRLLDRTEALLERVCTRTCDSACARYLGWVVVFLVVALVCALGAVGVYPVIYGTFQGRPLQVNVLVTLTLTFNVLYNYYYAATLCAGSVAQYYRLKPAPHAFSNFTFCGKCQQHKPPDAHHCSICHMCVVEMDHHCIFIKNCVGRGNIRHFLLFLFWTTAAMIYAVPICFVSILDHTSHVVEAYSTLKQSRRYRRGRFFTDPTFCYRLVTMLPAKFTLSLYLLIVCLVVLATCGMLCVRHWGLAAEGNTYIDSLKGAAPTDIGVIENLRHVFGDGHPCSWILPQRQHEDCRGYKVMKKA